jgi:hypothetical protein
MSLDFWSTITIPADNGSKRQDKYLFLGCLYLFMKANVRKIQQKIDDAD